MIPTRRLLTAVAAWAALGLLASIWPALQILWQIGGAALALAAVSDALNVWRQRGMQVERTVSGSLPVGVWSKVSLRIHNPGNAPINVTAYDHHPAHAETQHLPLMLTVPEQGWVDGTYRIRPVRRGPAEFSQTQVRIRSPLGLWGFDHRLGEQDAIKVYPNFAVVMKYALLATENRLGSMGIRRHRRRGEGLEFQQLRDYRVGDSLRQIDWKATSRIRRLISREYQDERDQRLVFLVDCSRRMRAEDGKLSHFDHSLNAVLLLSRVALQQGDAVGLMTFSGEQRWLSPRKGVGNVNQVLNTVYDLEPSLQTPDYSAAAQALLLRQRKRSLIVLITNVRDEDSEDLLPALALLRKHHLVLLASLRESVIDEALEQTVSSFDTALEHGAVHQYVAYRREAHAKLSQRGALVLDVTPEELPLRAVNRYLDIKSSGML